MKNTMRTRPLVSISMATMLALSACDAHSRKIAGDYHLRQTLTPPGATSTDTSYFLWDTARPENEIGWSGAVVRIGWDADHIVVLRSSPPAREGFGAGWMVVDVGRGAHSGILTEEQVRQQPAIAHIATYRADSAWAKL